MLFIVDNNGSQLITFHQIYFSFGVCYTLDTLSKSIANLGHGHCAAIPFLLTMMENVHLRMMKNTQRTSEEVQIFKNELMHLFIFYY